METATIRRTRMDTAPLHPAAAARRPGSGSARTGLTTPGFTLIELLVTIAILAILAGLLIPMVGRARQKATMATCANNLRQIMIACINYADDHSGRYPDAQRQYGFPHEYRKYEETLASYLSATTRAKTMFCPGPLSRERNASTPLYDTHYTTYQYFNFPSPFLGTYQGNNKPDMSRSATMPVRAALWGCLTIQRDNGTALAHNEPNTAQPVSGMNAAFPDGHSTWQTLPSLEKYWMASGAGYYWPLPPAP